MADFELSHFKGCWAKTSSPFTLWKFCEHLFQHKTAKRPLNLNCFAELVSFRISPFAKSWHVLERSLYAEFSGIRGFENGWLFWKICWHEVSHVDGVLPECFSFQHVLVLLIVSMLMYMMRRMHWCVAYWLWLRNVLLDFWKCWTRWAQSL